VSDTRDKIREALDAAEAAYGPPIKRIRDQLDESADAIAACLQLWPSLTETQRNSLLVKIEANAKLAVATLESHARAAALGTFRSVLRVVDSAAAKALLAVLA
jgi:hypothetical protein